MPVVLGKGEGIVRTRDLKPGFFKNEVLAKLDPRARLLFAGLWCLADRDGRLEDRPARIAGEIFPYEKPPIEKLLATLADTGFITRYCVEGKDYIWLRTFKSHQNVHPHEKASVIPACPDEPGNVITSSYFIPSTSMPSCTSIPSEPSSPLLPPAPDEPARARRGRLGKEWENRVGVLPPIARGEFDRYAEELPEEWFMDAIDITVTEANRPSWKFCSSVLKRCAEEQVPPRGAVKAPTGLSEILARRVGSRR